ncbi:PrsW family intramembrane metalloprotease [Dehalogenimonas alkenigignens]|uniref:Putative membrane protein n=1 Tax=Dehalogenimonas alkenigignens TaxID=1217799 RepID=A0A0W0GIK9_9CHLR|nr:PrsW family glutamic-type intramembrane protease [Dehalogenimonas alkenigignens]KTB48415.1 putative membrane protein [Dehalogenimonas alkenigignens]
MISSYIFRKAWIWILLVGVLLFFGANAALRWTGNPNFFPTVIMLGAFIVPLAYVVFFYEHVRDRNIPVLLLGVCFLVGGALGIIAAGFLHYAVLREADLLGLLKIGIIEESSKLILPILLFLAWRFHHQADGLLFGISAGMGFAALETMGYGLAALIESQGDPAAVEQVLLIRGLLSPAGHAAWTGIVCAVLWGERVKFRRVTINARVLGAFVLAVVLHTAWNAFSLFRLPDALTYTGMITVGILSLGTLLALYHQARLTPAVPVALENLLDLAAEGDEQATLLHQEGNSKK